MLDKKIGDEIIRVFNLKLSERYQQDSFFRIDESDNIIAIEIIDNQELVIEKLVRYLAKLKFLNSLTLKECKIGDLSALKELNNLTSLNLESSTISDINPIKKLINLKHLNLSTISISINCDIINSIKNLETFEASNNEKTDFSKLEGNNNLKILNLRNSGLVELKFIENFKNLLELDLSANKIKDCENIKKLTNLEYLSLNDNFLTDISFIKDLKKLKSFYAINNKISNINVLSELNEIEHINLGVNSITDVKSVKNLKKIKTLWLINNKIKDISPISGLYDLEALSLAKNKIKDISYLKSLTKIKTLHLQDNQISDISHLKNIVELHQLSIGNNEIEDLGVLKCFKKINNIDLKNNPISQLPNWITSLGLNIIWDKYGYRNEALAFYENPIKSPPIEIVKQGNEAIKRYFEKISEEGEDYIYEVKLTLVGEGSSGKTSLQKRLLNEKSALPKKDTRTRGIEIKDWKFKKDKRQQYVAHIWDFGGQDVYYPVHRFFMTENSVFVLLASTRQTHHNFDYWIPTIHQFGSKSPIILCQTCHDGNKIPWNDLGTFVGDSNFNIIKTTNIPYYEINLPNSNEGLEKLKQILVNQIINLPHYGKGVPKSWVPVRNILEEESKRKPCIAFESFVEICRDSNPISFISLTDIEDCCRFLHDIGVVLWYSTNEDLKNWVILQPEWAMNAVYKIIDDEEIQNRKGHILSRDFKRLWKDTHYVDKHLVLKKMLEIFKIAFPKKHKKEDYIIPARLPSMPTEMRWNENSLCLSVEYKYLFMPRGLVNQLSAEMSRYIVNINEVWNNAVNFYMDNGSSCQVIEDFYNRKISIKAKGQDARSLIILVMDSLNNVTEEFKGVKTEIYVPCSCESCKTNENPTTYLYDKLKEWSTRDSNATVFCNEGRVTLGIDELLYSLGLSKSKKEDKLMINRKITVFLASSSELKSDREQFEIFINRQNKQLYDKGIFIQLELWEDFIDSMSKTKLQDEYNKVVQNADIFVSLFFTKVGKYTAEEFNVAFKQFSETDKPRIYTYFKSANINISSIKEDEIKTKFEFESKLKSLGHFPTQYDSVDSLKFHFSQQLNKLLAIL